jgi:hypothetical protein
MFCKDKVTFLGYVVSVQGVKVDESKIEAIKNSLHQMLVKIVAFMILLDFIDGL